MVGRSVGWCARGSRKLKRKLVVGLFFFSLLAAAAVGGAVSLVGAFAQNAMPFFYFIFKNIIWRRGSRLFIAKNGRRVFLSYEGGNM